MCMFCAAIPATAAVGAKLNADQLYKEESRRLPISKITTLLIGLLVMASAIYHTLVWRNWNLDEVFSHHAEQPLLTWAFLGGLRCALKTKKPLIFNESGACCLYKSISHQVLLQPFMRDHSSAVVFPPWAIFQRDVYQRLSRWQHQTTLEGQSGLKQSSAFLPASAEQLSPAKPLLWQYTREKRCLHLD